MDFKNLEEAVDFIDGLDGLLKAEATKVDALESAIRTHCNGEKIPENVASIIPQEAKWLDGFRLQRFTKTEEHVAATIELRVNEHIKANVDKSWIIPGIKDDGTFYAHLRKRSLEPKWLRAVLDENEKLTREIKMVRSQIPEMNLARLGTAQSNARSAVRVVEKNEPVPAPQKLEKPGFLVRLRRAVTAFTSA